MTGDSFGSKSRRSRRDRTEARVSTSAAQDLDDGSERTINEQSDSSQAPRDPLHIEAQSIGNTNEYQLVHNSRRPESENSIPSSLDSSHRGARFGSDSELTPHDESRSSQRDDIEPVIAPLKRMGTYADPTKASKARQMSKVKNENSGRIRSARPDAIKRPPKPRRKTERSRYKKDSRASDNSGEESGASSMQGSQPSLENDSASGGSRTPSGSVDRALHTASSSSVSSWGFGSVGHGAQTPPETSRGLGSQIEREEVVSGEGSGWVSGASSNLGIHEIDDIAQSLAKTRQLYESYEEAKNKAPEYYVVHPGFSGRETESTQNEIISLPNFPRQSSTEQRSDRLTEGLDEKTGHDTQSQRHDGAAKPDEKTNDEVKGFSGRWRDLRKDLMLRIESLEAEIDLQSKQLSQQSRQNQDLETQNKLLRNMHSTLEEQYMSKSEDLKNAIAAAAQIYDEQNESSTLLKDLQEEVDLVCSVMNTIPTLEYTALQELRRASTEAAANDDDNLSKLRRHLFTLLNHYEDQRKDFMDKIDSQKDELAWKDRLISYQHNTSQDNHSPIQTLTNQLERQHDRETFERLYHAERGKRKLSEQRLEQAQQQVDSSADCEKENEALMADLAQANATITDLQEQLKNLNELWESEVKEPRNRHQLREEQLEQIIHEQNNEMLMYIKEYRDKTNDEKHWEFAGLQRTIRNLELDIKSVRQVLEQTKRDKARLEDEIAGLQESHTLGMENVERPEILPTRTASPPIPNCHLPAGIAEREAQLAVLREQQHERREQERLFAEFMEKLRKWKMGEHYPPGKKGWKEVVQKGMWNRWDGDAWVLLFGGREERELAEMIKKNEVVKGFGGPVGF